MEHFHTTSTCIIFSNSEHHVDILLRSDLKKHHMLYDEKDAEFAFHFFVANLSDNAVVLNANSFQVLFRDIVYFSTTFSQNIFQNPQIRLRETETKHLKKGYFFLTIANKVLISSQVKSKKFPKQFEILFFFLHI